MRKMLDGVMYIVLVILIVILGVLVFKNYTMRDVPGKEEIKVTQPEDIPEVVFPSTGDKYMPEAGENAYSVNLAVAGDMVIHSGLNDEAYNAESQTYDYSDIFAEANGILTNADFSVACLETTFPDTREYTGYPLFCSPESLAGDIKESGIDLLSTASNHALDGYVGGLRRTLDILDKNEIMHVGTYRSQEERDEHSGVSFVEIGGIKVAFLAYAYGTNGSSYYGNDYCINIYHEDYMGGTGEVRYDMMKSDIDYAKSQNADIIAAFMHWGQEYAVEPNAEQKEIADFLFYEGADIILGGHTHVPEPMELREFEDKNGEKKTGFIVYSLGNFISCQNDARTNLTAVVNLELTKDPDSGECWVSGAGYTPMFMVDLEDYGINSTEAGWHYRLWDLHKAIDGYAAGDNRGVINSALLDAMNTGLDEIHSILGREFDLYYLKSGTDAA